MKTAHTDKGKQGSHEKMERNSLFLDRENQYDENGCPSKLMLDLMQSQSRLLMMLLTDLE